MTILLTFIGSQDPYSLGLVGEEEQPGPILAMAGARRYDRILLLATRDQGPKSGETRGAVLERCPGVEVDIFELPLDNLNDGAAILRALRSGLLPSLESCRDADLCVSLSSGTPQTHTAWFLLLLAIIARSWVVAGVGAVRPRLR